MKEETKKKDYSQFYLSNLARFVAAFDKTRLAVVDHIAKQSSAEAANEIGDEAALNFEKILPQLPYVGGDANPATRFIVNAGQWIAVYKSMAKRGYKALEVGRMMYSIYEDNLKRVPPDDWERQKELIFSDEYIDFMRMWAESTSPFESDWEFDFIEGDGVDFDYGLDFRACPCLELFKSQNAGQLAPYNCLIDFPEAKRQGSGLLRTKTLAQGDEVCNFRYKRGGEVVQSWDTEVGKILDRQNQNNDPD